MSDELRKKAKGFRLTGCDAKHCRGNVRCPQCMADFASEQIAIAVKTERARIADRLDEIAGEDTWLYDLDEFRDELRGKLKPCPWCGSRVSIMYCDEGCCGAKPRGVECDNRECGFDLFSVSADDDSQAIAQWNSRTEEADGIYQKRGRK